MHICICEYLYARFVIDVHAVWRYNVFMAGYKISKRAFNRKKPTSELGHFEGKYWCGCRIRGYRKWLAMKRGLYCGMDCCKR